MCGDRENLFEVPASRFTDELNLIPPPPPFPVELTPMECNEIFFRRRISTETTHHFEIENAVLGFLEKCNEPRRQQTKGLLEPALLIVCHLLHGGEKKKKYRQPFVKIFKSSCSRCLSLRNCRNNWHTLCRVRVSLGDSPLTYRSSLLSRRSALYRRALASAGKAELSLSYFFVSSFELID